MAVSKSEPLARYAHNCSASWPSCAQSVKWTCAISVVAPAAHDSKIGPGFKWLSTRVKLLILFGGGPHCSCLFVSSSRLS